MLVLSRKVGERILVGDQIRITVVRLTSGGVRLGIEAPDGTTVIREELMLKLLDDQQRAGEPSAAALPDNDRSLAGRTPRPCR